MSLAQLHYTSAPPGPDGSGFRFTAVTPDMPQSLLREAEQLIGYEPPRDAPPRPTDAELAGFPKMLSHSLLSDGSRLLCRTVYTGSDYSGRWGNFHAHAVHLPAHGGLPGDELPITTWDSPRWSVSTPDAGVPTPLGSLTPSGFFDRNGLIEFAASRAPWLTDFFSDLRRSSEDPNAPQIILIERDSADVARWIALAAAVLPRELAHQLTFTTYTRRPQLARQQIIGVLPADGQGLAGYEDRYRVHDCTAPGPTKPATDAWAETAAQVWLGKAPEVFKEAAALPGEHFTAGPLAAVALCARVMLPSRGRAAAAEWTRSGADTLGGQRLRRLVDALSRLAADRTPAETAALCQLLAALNGKAPVITTAPLAAVVLTEAVRRDPGVELPDLRTSELTDDLRQRLCAELRPDLRAGIADSTQDVSRRIELLRLADTLALDCTDLLPDVVRRLCRALLADPDAAYTPAVRSALQEQFNLRAALLAKCDDAAAGDPPSASRLLTRTGLSLDGVQALPHLRMCAEAPAATVAGCDRVTALHNVLRAGGVSAFTEPLVLRTAVRLVWDDSTPTAGEARLLLAGLGSDVHRAADTWREIVKAALEAPADDPDAAHLAPELLRCFSGELAPRQRAALLLLEFARDLREGQAGTGWADRALALRAAAESPRPAVLEHAFGALARRLLSQERPDGELYALIHSGDRDLIAAYGRAAQEDRVGDRLRIVPEYVADCFVSWSSHPQAGGAWHETRTALLDKVLRPIVRALTDEDISSVERHLERTGDRWADEFRAWNRPGAFGRLGRRFGGRGQRSTVRGPRWGDVEPPRKDGRSS
ncbi:GTPase-associated protein 1-related protein [Streptomyces celluloflavus]|uniref:GTPase-associated protein 1-related protein n=1 Tax=Streptomyces celluloflavus TaxID=58344 RepID=UPI0036DDB273